MSTASWHHPTFKGLPLGMLRTGINPCPYLALLSLSVLPGIVPPLRDYLQGPYCPYWALRQIHISANWSPEGKKLCTVTRSGASKGGGDPPPTIVQGGGWVPLPLERSPVELGMPCIPSYRGYGERRGTTFRLTPPTHGGWPSLTDSPPQHLGGGHHCNTVQKREHNCTST